MHFFSFFTDQKKKVRFQVRIILLHYLQVKLTEGFMVQLVELVSFIYINNLFF